VKSGKVDERWCFILKRFRPAFAEAATRRQVQGFLSVPVESICRVSLRLVSLRKSQFFFKDEWQMVHHGKKGDIVEGAGGERQTKRMLRVVLEVNDERIYGSS
jgi:hypothetical protein